MKQHSRAMAVACLPALAVLSATRGARADMASSFQPGLYLPVGMNIGTSLPSLHRDLPPGVLVGAEVSLVDWDDVLPRGWVGGYVDALWDSGAGALRASVGPEIGWRFVGVDLGYVLQAGPQGAHHGLAVRPVLTFGFFAIEGRYGHLFGDVRGADFLEVGVLIKVPIEVNLDPPEPPPPAPRPGGPPRPPSNVAPDLAPDLTPEPARPGLPAP